MSDLSMVGLNDCIKLGNIPLAAVVNFCGKIQRLIEIKRWVMSHPPTTLYIVARVKPL